MSTPNTVTAAIAYVPVSASQLQTSSAGQLDTALQDVYAAHRQAVQRYLKLQSNVHDHGAATKPHLKYLNTKHSKLQQDAARLRRCIERCNTAKSS